MKKNIIALIVIASATFLSSVVYADSCALLSATKNGTMFLRYSSNSPWEPFSVTANTTLSSGNVTMLVHSSKIYTLISLKGQCSNGQLVLEGTAGTNYRATLSGDINQSGQVNLTGVIGVYFGKLQLN